MSQPPNEKEEEVRKFFHSTNVRKTENENVCWMPLEFHSQTIKTSNSEINSENNSEHLVGSATPRQNTITDTTMNSSKIS